MASSTPPEESGPVYFWREFGETYSFLSQWYPEPFTAPSATPDGAERIFASCEQYMMYRKGMLFGDPETAEEIMQATSPKDQKALGRQVSGFTDAVWCSNRELIVVDGNWYKFTNPVGGSEDLKKKLLATGDRELVEASPRDRIWGIGFGAKNAGSRRKKWGQNLLGKCLMVVRDRIREVEERKLRKEEEEEEEEEEEDVDPVDEG